MLLSLPEDILVLMEVLVSQEVKFGFSESDFVIERFSKFLIVLNAQKVDPDDVKYS